MPQPADHAIFLFKSIANPFLGAFNISRKLSQLFSCISKYSALFSANILIAQDMQLHYYGQNSFGCRIFGEFTPERGGVKTSLICSKHIP